jgi:hypothetical protein
MNSSPSQDCAKTSYFKLKHHQSLVAYSAMSAALLLTWPDEAKALISYTDIDPDTTLILGDNIFRLDIDGDGITDFKFGINAFSGTFTVGSLAGQTFYFNGAFGFGEDGAAFAGEKQALDFNTYYLPQVYEAGNYIGASANWQPAEALGSLNYRIDPDNTAATTGGYWLDRNDGYLAIQFFIEDNLHYGWVRLDVTSPGLSNQITLKDYAYEQEAWNGITAGAIDGGVIPNGIKTPELTDFTVYGFGGSIFINNSNLEQNVDVTLYSVLGSLIKFEKMAHSSLEFSTLEPGYYLVHITSENGILTRKVYTSQ